MTKIDKINMTKVGLMITIFIIFINVVSANVPTITGPLDSSPPASITGLKNITYKSNYINWTWIDPKNADFAKVKVYINGIFKTDVLKGKRYYNATGLAAYTVYTTGTHTVDTSGNINQTWVNKSARTAKDNIPPSSVSKLHDISYAPTYINWIWNNPSNPDFAYTKVYIDGIWKKNVLKGTRYYNLTGLLPNTTHKISTRTVDTSGNINKTWVNHTAKTTPKSYILKIITVGDPHIDSHTTIEKENLKDVISYSNTADTNLVVVLGDITDDKSTSEFDASKSILDKSNKEYFAIPGSHDISAYNTSDSKFESYFGSMEKLKVRNGYQLLFIGTWKEIGSDGKQILRWKYNFSKANKNLPTLVFIHGAVKNPPPGYPCSWSERYFKYGASMQAELDKFNKLIGVYSGHVHDDTNQVFSTPLSPQVRYTTINGLNYADTGCILADPSTKVGYSVVRDGKLTYSLVPYRSESRSINGSVSNIVGEKVYKKEIED